MRVARSEAHEIEGQPRPADLPDTRLERLTGARPAGRPETRLELLAETLPALLGPLDAATLEEFASRLEWVTLRRGEALFRQGDPPDAWYVVARGRLRLVSREAGREEIDLGEVGRGTGLGEEALIAGMPHRITPVALRDSLLVRFSAAHFDQIIERHPAVMRSIARTLARRSPLPPAARPDRAPCLHIAVIPATPDVPIAGFTRHLQEALEPLGPTLRLAADDGSIPDPLPDWLPFSAWLDDHAHHHRFVLFACDARPGPFSRRALQEADHVLIVADATRPPGPHALERDLLAPTSGPYHARRTLVLLHPPETRLPRGTAAWLASRDVQDHHHVRLDRSGDVSRIARRLAGVAVGLVLGAGGARGFAHVGVLRALEEAGIPIDHIGGPSIGALAAALHAMGHTPDEVMALGQRAVAMGPFSEFTLPLTSLMRGARVEQIAAMLFGDVRIEDLWIPFFCTSCDLSTFQDVIYERGDLTSAILASSALPGVLPPQIRGGRIMVDGGTTDMLPGRLMRARCPGTLIAVDVSRDREMSYPAERYPTSWAALWERMRPGGRPTPLLPELFLRAASFGVSRQIGEVAEDADLFLRPPIEQYGTTQVKAIEEIAAIGYDYARRVLAGFRLK